MPRTYRKIPPLTRTPEVGDRYTSTQRARKREFVIVGKIYNEDLSLSYRTEPVEGTGARNTSTVIHEDSLRTVYKRIRKTRRTPVVLVEGGPNVEYMGI